MTPGHQLIDTLAGQLEDKLAADEHREDLLAVAERAATEAAAARRRQHPVLAEELLDQVFIALLGRHASKDA
ncbi:MAG TPA: hypothetical protein VKH61_00300, partial [Streptosporangiaceae bacterium]|nr:hypothetical protein [Streptosporangiaceae bacterium]